MFASLNNYSQKAPVVFQSPGTKLVTVPSYGSVGYPNKGANLPSSYASLGSAYQVSAGQNNNQGNMNGNMSLMNAYTEVQRYAPVSTMPSAAYTPENIARVNAIYN